MNYKASQTGWLVIAMMLPIIALLVVLYVTQWGDHPVPFLPFLLITLLLVILLLLFYKLTVKIDGTSLKLIYGIGLIRFVFKMDQLQSTQSIKTPWYYGLGIRITPKGMLYNIHGLKAAEIKYVRKGDHKSVMVGTAEPEQLIQALELNIKRIKTGSN